MLLSDGLMRKSMGSWSCQWMVVALVLLLVSLELARHQAEAARIYRSTTDPHALRLCSRSLSDALYLICKDRGFNEPFSSSSSSSEAIGEGKATGAGGGSPSVGSGISIGGGGGLVEECCHHSCSYEQMEQYCKPAQPSKN